MSPCATGEPSTDRTDGLWLTGHKPTGPLGTAAGLPLSLAPGESGSFTISGSYELVSTDEGNKANLHFVAVGTGDESGEAFSLGINIHLRAPGVANGTDSGPPEGTPPGPPDDRPGC